MNEYRYFSPSFSRSQYINKVKSWSEETCHNLIRLILRPDHKSASHWINEMTIWIYNTLSINISSKNKPIEYIFDWLAIIETKKFSWSKDMVESWLDKVGEEKYGKPKNITVNQAIDKLDDLLKLLKNCSESITYSDLKKLLIDWSKS